MVQADCPNIKALTIKEIEDIQTIEEESSEEEDNNDGFTWWAPILENCCWSKDHSMWQGFLMTLAKENKSSFEVRH